MSWIYATLGRPVESITGTDLFDRPDIIYRNMVDSINVIAGGIGETCLSGEFSPEKPHKYTYWLIVGVGLQCSDGGYETMGIRDWEGVLNDLEPNLMVLNGHFVCIRWNDRWLELYTDPLGLRTVYVAQQKERFIISTRMDWIAHETGFSDIDDYSYGSSWLAYNQLSTKCVLKNITRIGPNGKVVIKNNRLTIKENYWRPSSVQTTDKNIEETLRAFVNSKISKNSEKTLALSGGLDSRVLFSLLNSHKNTKKSILSLGCNDHPDVITALDIIKDKQLDYFYYKEIVPDADQLVRSLTEYGAYNQSIAPASAILLLGYYDKIYNQNNCLIDGGFGEIGRRMFFKKLLLKGWKAIKSKNPEQFARFILTHRADIFTDDKMDVMKEGMIAEIDEYLQKNITTNKLDYNNFVDLFAVHTRLPNYYGFEQARLDEKILNYMPFAQQDFLNLILTESIYKRMTGKLYKSIILNNAAELRNYPLVKGDYSYPFSLNPFIAQIFCKLKHKFSPFKEYNVQHDFLNVLSEYVQDIVHSTEMENINGLDFRKVRCIIKEYYSGNRSKANELDWFLSYYFWIKNIMRI